MIEPILEVLRRFMTKKTLCGLDAAAFVGFSAAITVNRHYLTKTTINVQNYFQTTGAY